MSGLVCMDTVRVYQLSSRQRTHSQAGLQNGPEPDGRSITNSYLSSRRRKFVGADSKTMRLIFNGYSDIGDTDIKRKIPKKERTPPPPSPKDLIKPISNLPHESLRESKMQVNNVLVRRRLSVVNLTKENVEILLVENAVALAEPWSVGVGNSYLEISEKLDVERFKSVYTIAINKSFI